MESRTGTKAEGHLLTPWRCRGKVVLRPNAPHAASGPAGPAWAWLPPVRTRGQYLRGHGRGARPAAAGNTSKTRSWPACRPRLRPPPLLAAGRLFSGSSAPPRTRPAPGSTSGLAHVVPQSFNNNFIRSQGLHEFPRGRESSVPVACPLPPPGTIQMPWFEIKRLIRVPPHNFFTPHFSYM